MTVALDPAVEKAALERAHREVERFVRRRGALPLVDADDVVQEAVARLLENRARLDPAAWPSYAVASAGNLLRDAARADDVRRRNAHRLHDPQVEPVPDELVLTAEEHRALRAALADVGEDDAALLREHYDGELSNRSITPRTAARLARARARLRVSFLLRHAGVPLPTERCRGVLEALSSGERRRQQRTGAARHLAACRTCTSYAPALVQRQRALAGVHPLAWLGVGAAAVWQSARRHPQQTGAATALAAVVLVAAVQTAPSPGPTSAPAPSSRLVVAGQSVLPRLGEPDLPVGPAVATDVPVHSVPADEGFWVGSGPGRRIWVRLVSAGESPVTVRPGDRVSFRGRAVPTRPGFAAQVGLAGQSAAELAAVGRHIEVRPDQLTVR